MRIFALEYFRKIINSNEINFLSAKKKTQFKIKNKLGPFICNNREARQEANKILQHMNFKSSFMCQYDPNGVINKLRLEFKLSPFIHDPRPNIERYAKESEWLENTLLDVEKHIDTSSFL